MNVNLLYIIFGNKIFTVLFKEITTNMMYSNSIDKHDHQRDCTIFGMNMISFRKECVLKSLVMTFFHRYGFILPICYDNNGIKSLFSFGNHAANHVCPQDGVVFVMVIYLYSFKYLT